MQRYTVYFIWKLLYMLRAAPPPIISSENNCIYSIWYIWHIRGLFKSIRPLAGKNTFTRL